MAGEPKPACNLLEQFILLARGTSGSALIALINQVLEAPGIYVFGELLELTNVREVSAGHVLFFTCFHAGARCYSKIPVEEKSVAQG
uniref:COP9 signalosome subunit 7B n=1 Tax=Pseudonaja textilis TaxID=8673 RepID=A0A670ZGP2_PSETE